MSDSSTAIRLNPFKPCTGTPSGTPVPWNKYGRILSERPVFTLDPLFHAGAYYVQDSSAMFVGHILRKYLPETHSAKDPIKVLDLCAAPGGKTTDIATSLREIYQGNFLLVSNEVMKDRSRILADNVGIWGDPNIMVTSADPAAFARFEGLFDVIVADVPCSGEGMFRKDQKAVDQWSPEVVDLCAARQKRILADVWPALRPGGLLVYSTCTYEQSENDDNLEWAATELGGQIFETQDEFGSFGVELTKHGSLLRAGVVPGEGQWAGALRKSGTQPPHTTSVQSAAQVVGNRLKAIKYGIPQGETKAGKIIPDPDYALSLAYAGEYPETELDKQTALRFLHHDPIKLPASSPRGFNLLKYNGLGLGFVNNLGTRCNTLHPLSRRILMDIPNEI